MQLLADGEPPGAQVVLSGPQLPEPLRQDSQQGQARFPNLVAGTYAVAVTAVGFVPARQEGVEVTAGQTTPVTIPLEQTTGSFTLRVEVAAKTEEGQEQPILRGVEVVVALGGQSLGEGSAESDQPAVFEELIAGQEYVVTGSLRGFETATKGVSFEAEGPAQKSVVLEMIPVPAV